MEIKASMVKELREMTGAGMMDCKKALSETDGDMDKAVEYLREHGQAKAEKKASRIAAEGICKVIQEGDDLAAVVEVNSETDFVASNEIFQGFVEEVARQALKTESEDIDSFLNEKFIADDAKTVSEALVEKIAVIGEKLSIRRFKKVKAEGGLVVSYTHGGGHIAVIVNAKTAVVNDSVKDALKNVAMQIAAMSPKYVSDKDVDQAYIESETQVIREQINNDEKESKKPENVKEGMIKGRISKLLKEVCLLDQVYVRSEDGKQSVKKYLEAVSKENGTDIEIVEFVRFETGEGMEKKEENFAEEVAAQLG